MSCTCFRASLPPHLFSPVLPLSESLSLFSWSFLEFLHVCSCLVIGCVSNFMYVMDQILYNSSPHAHHTLTHFHSCLHLYSMTGDIEDILNILDRQTGVGYLNSKYAILGHFQKPFSFFLISIFIFGE